MAVDVAAEVGLGIVEVHAAQVLEADDVLELRHGDVVSLLRADVVARREHVAGVDADADARLVFDLVDDVGEVLELPAEVAALPRRVLQHQRHPAGVVEGTVHALGDVVQALLFADLLEVRTGVEVEPVEPQLHAAFRLVQEGVEGFLPLLRIRMAEVDQVRIVRQYVLGRDPALFEQASEGVDGLRVQRLRRPLPLVLRKQRERPRPDGLRVLDGVKHPARSGRMRADVLIAHKGFLQIFCVA